MLAAPSKADITMMLAHFQEDSAKYGLKLIFEKTKVLTWIDLHPAHRTSRIGNDVVDMLDENASEKNWGRQLTFANTCHVELEN